MPDKLNNKKYYIAELFVAYYINSFAILKPILNRYSYISNRIMLMEIVFLFGFYFIYYCFNLSEINFKWMIGLIAIVTAIFGIDYLLRGNAISADNYYYFLVYGVVTALLFLNVRSISKLLVYWCIFAVAGGLVLIADPLNGYAICGDYMSFGFNILPAFAACVVVFEYYRKRIILPLLLVFLVEILAFAHKGASVTACVLVLFFIVFTTENKKKKYARIVTLVLAFVILSQCLPMLLDIIEQVAGKFGVGSYSITDFKRMLSPSGRNKIFLARIEIWENAFYELKTNWFFGMGMGNFQLKYGNYPHNFFLDLLVTHGLLITIIVLGIIGYFVGSTMKTNNKDMYIFSSVLFLLWFVQMMFSFTFWNVNLFWFYIILNIMYSFNLSDLNISKKIIKYRE